jgi:hypothetical protein
MAATFGLDFFGFFGLKNEPNRGRLLRYIQHFVQVAEGDGNGGEAGADRRWLLLSEREQDFHDFLDRPYAIEPQLDVNDGLGALGNAIVMIRDRLHAANCH